MASGKQGEDPKDTIARLWGQQSTPTAKVGRKFLAGQWVTRDDVLAVDMNTSNLTQIVNRLREAGYVVEEEQVNGSNAKRWRVVDNSAPVPVKREVHGHTHPDLGSVLTVRALVMNDDGELAMSLSNGARNWTVVITGHGTTKGGR